MGVIVPVGAVEQHGPYLPVTCDTDIATGAAEALAIALSGHGAYRAWTAPAVAYGPVPGAELTAGTSSVSFDALGEYLRAVVAGFLATGDWDYLILLNAHAHNHGRVIEASSRAFVEFRRPVSVLQIYEYLHVASDLGLAADSHAGEREIALHHHYTGRAPAAALAPTGERRPRPPSIYGLDLLPRSLRGVVAAEPPLVSRAVSAAAELGRRVDAALAARAMADLDTYFAHWHGAPEDRGARS